MNKTIVIIDCFVHNDMIKQKLISRIDSIRKIGIEILLISNTKITDQEIIDGVDYLIYISKNNLFQKEYTGYSVVDYWSNHGHFTAHNMEVGRQRHGLSVLINIITSLKFAASLGYTNFHRLEADADISDVGFRFIEETDKRMREGEIDGVLYLNESNGTRWGGGNASFQYMSSDIKTFIDNFPELKSEDDYVSYLLGARGNMDFMIAEDFLYEILKNKTSEKLIIRNATDEMNRDFEDTLWNTSTTPSMDNNVSGCITGCYKKIGPDGNLSGFCIYSKNVTGGEMSRKIKVTKNDGSTFYIDQNVPGLFCWAYSDLPEEAVEVEIYSEDGDILTKEEVKEDKIWSYLQFH